MKSCHLHQLTVTIFHDKMKNAMFKCLSDICYSCYDSFIMYEMIKMKMSDRDTSLCVER